MGLTEQIQRIISRIQDDLGVVAGGYPVAEIGGIFEGLSQDFQSLAACNLLLFGAGNGFFRNLFTSGYTRRYFLRRCRAETGLQNEYMAISRSQSFFDVVAAGSLDLAREIATLSPTEWIPDGEYEDDFCYVWFLHSFIQDLVRPDNAYMSSVLERFERCVSKDTSARLEICWSLLLRDQVTFDKSFSELLEFREAQVEEGMPLAGDDPGYGPRGAIFVEGLALIRLASTAGLVTREEYALCPVIAHVHSERVPEEDIYEDMDRIIAG